MSPNDTQELLKPPLDDLGPKPFWLLRLFGKHQHCFHENGRYNKPDSGVMVRICCHCGINQKSELVPVTDDHGTFVPVNDDTVWNWNKFKRWKSPEECNQGGYY